MPDEPARSEDRIDKAAKVTDFFGKAMDSYYRWLLAGPLGSWRGFVAFLITGGTIAVLCAVGYRVYYFARVHTECQFQDIRVDPPNNPIK